ncbi:unnamed protein product (macronuclear) [Paramecium tetraurelia]|uniref:Ribosomal protein L5 n=1 Tax=Paramecium tetraurelia TaxID=5888 RepID=A0DWJ2_PARTE|nr:uncharacterized protein GSPATT00021052001 [Paramecium tetraurelia]CAK87409.1 unnamed protein product [Paramecium tetraurelia]|eukprot:XP_001454806.1 hypothetical protein (macronuclear) [Paramecium tetraurelia strain d4-2]
MFLYKKLIQKQIKNYKYILKYKYTDKYVIFKHQSKDRRQNYGRAGILFFSIFSLKEDLWKISKIMFSQNQNIICKINSNFIVSFQFKKISSNYNLIQSHLNTIIFKILQNQIYEGYFQFKLVYSLQYANFCQLCFQKISFTYQLDSTFLFNTISMETIDLLKSHNSFCIQYKFEFPYFLISRPFISFIFVQNIKQDIQIENIIFNPEMHFIKHYKHHKINQKLIHLGTFSNKMRINGNFSKIKKQIS